MHYLLYLLISIVCILGVHSYLLHSQRHERKWSISVHAAKHSKTLTIYLLGHIIGGGFFVLFAYSYFYALHDLKLLFLVACVAVFFEYLQACLPAKGKTNSPHELAAYIMWVLFIVVSLIAYFQLSLSAERRLLIAPLLIASIVMFIYVHYNHTRLYLYQMWMTALVFFALFVMIV